MAISGLAPSCPDMNVVLWRLRRLLIRLLFLCFGFVLLRPLRISIFLFSNYLKIKIMLKSIGKLV